MITVSVMRERLELHTPFEYKDVIKTIPQARWDPEAKVWHTRATPSNLIAVNEILSEHIALMGLKDEIFWDRSCQPLIDQAWAVEQAAGLKTAEELPDHPSKTSSWLHQRRVYDFMNALGYGGIFSDMGAGKSKCIVDLVANNGWKRSLILCPRKAIGVWPKQFRLHCIDESIEVIPLWNPNKIKDGQPVNLTISERVEIVTRRYDHPVVFVTNFEAAVYDAFQDALLEHGDLGMVAVDEAHRIKKPGGVTSRFLARLGDKVEHRFALTGTPLHHRPLDAYAIYRFLDKGVFGTSFARFKERYAVTDRWGYRIEEYINQDELSDKMWRIAFRVTKDILDLPEEVSTERTFYLEGTARDYYKSMKKDGIVRISHNHGNAAASVATNVLTKRLRLHQITGGSLRLDNGTDIHVGGGKADLLSDVLEDLPEGEPVVVACLYHADLDAVRVVAEKHGLRYGEVSGRRNDLTIDSTYPEGVDLLAVQIRAGGVAIDLTRSHYLVFYSMGESLGDYRQMQSRVHRPGQTQPVIYVHLLAEGTIDRAIMTGIQENGELVDYITEYLRKESEEEARVAS